MQHARICWDNSYLVHICTRLVLHGYFSLGGATTKGSGSKEWYVMCVRHQELVADIDSSLARRFRLASNRDS